MSIPTEPEQAIPIQWLRCPATGQRLKFMKASALSALNERINRSEVRLREGSVACTTLEDALQTLDDNLVYPVQSGIPVLLPEEALAINPENKVHGS